MKKRRQHRNSSHIEAVITGGDIAIAAFSAIIYYTRAYIEGNLYTISFPAAVIWCNIFRLLLIYTPLDRTHLSPKSRFKLFIASNIAFIPIMGVLTTGSANEYYPLYLLLIIASAYRWEHKQALIVTILSSFGHFYAAQTSGGISVRDQVIYIGFLWIFYIFVKAIIEKLKSSQVKLMNVMDNLNQRTWELEVANGENQTIYNTVANLAGTIEVKEVVSKILIISTRLLGAKTCKAYRASSNGTYLYLLGEADIKNLNIYEKPKRASLKECLASVSTQNEDNSPINIIYETGSDLLDYINNNKIVVPLVARMKTIGYIFVESADQEGFSEKDILRYSVVSTSAGMALDNARLMQKNEELAIIDELMGIYNFRFFKDKLQTEIRRASRYNQQLSILMIDIDFFKKVNDSYGHQAGNMLLQQLSGLFRRCVREVDILARYGGEEFVIILPETTGTGAIIVAERIRNEVEESVFECGPEASEVKITVSIGISLLTKDNSKDPELLLKQADRNLYAAKRSGRNRVIFRLPHEYSIPESSPAKNVVFD